MSDDRKALVERAVALLQGWLDDPPDADEARRLAETIAALQPAAAAQGDAEPVWWALTSKYGTRFYSTESQMRDEAQPEEVIVPLYAAPPSAQGVPREPTEAMLNAGCGALENGGFADFWRAAYDAALAAQGEQAGETP